jgi:hypothetical protein
MAEENWAETTRTVEYEKAVEFELNERPGKLKPMATQYSSTSSKKQITDRFDDLYGEEIDERNGDTKNTDTEVERRWIHKPKRYAVAPLLDPDDEMSTEVGLRSPLSIGIAKDIRRYQDDKWLQGFYGPAYTGEEGLTSVPFKSANIIAADFGETATTYVGLTLKKLRQVRKLMRQRFVDTENEQINMLITAEEVDDLFEIDQFLNSRYNPDSQRRQMKPMSEGSKQALQDGEPSPFLGIVFWPTEFTNPKAYRFANRDGLTTNSSGHRRCPVWVNSGMAFCTWMDFTTRVDERADKNHSMQYAAYSCGRASRTNEDKCFIIETN